jgi:hypothetical protein
MREFILANIILFLAGLIVSTILLVFTDSFLLNGFLTFLLIEMLTKGDSFNFVIRKLNQ